MKKIGIDARFYGEAGPGRYAKNIVSGLEKLDTENLYYVFLRKKGFEMYQPQNPNFIKVMADYKWYSWSEQFGFLFKILKYRIDLLYVPHFNFPILYPGKLVTAIPDLIMHVYSTQKGSTLPPLYFKLKKLVYKFVVYFAVLRSHKVIVPSEDALNDFLHVYPSFNKDKYIVAQEGVDPDFIKFIEENSDEAVSVHDKIAEIKGIKTDKPFILYISSMYEHKNVPRLIEAFQILHQKFNDNIYLYIVGKKDKYSISTQELISKMGLSEFIFTPGNVSPVTDSQVFYLRSSALLYVFPSLKEGFSLTPMEAQANGLACLISDIPVHREIYQDTVAYFNPEDSLDMANKINNLLNDVSERARLTALGREHYKKFSWDITAEATLNEFKSALKLN